MVDSINTLIIINTLVLLLNELLWSGYIYSRAKNMPIVIAKIFHVLMYFSGIVFCVHTYFGQSIMTYLAFSGATAAVIGYFAREGISQIIAGVAISLAKNINKGNFIKLSEKIKGKIVELDWRSVTLRDLTGALIIIPNTKITESFIVNYSSCPRIRTLRSLFKFPGYINSSDVVLILIESVKELNLNFDELNYILKRKVDHYEILIIIPVHRDEYLTVSSNLIELMSFKMYTKGCTWIIYI